MTPERRYSLAHDETVPAPDRSPTHDTAVVARCRTKLLALRQDVERLPKEVSGLERVVKKLEKADRELLVLLLEVHERSGVPDDELPLALKQEVGRARSLCDELALSALYGS